MESVDRELLSSCLALPEGLVLTSQHPTATSLIVSVPCQRLAACCPGCQQPMTRDDLLIPWFCLIDDGLKTLWHGNRLRQRGPAPTLADSEVLTMEILGEYLGLNTDTAIFDFFRFHYRPFFPNLAHLHRTLSV